MAATMSYLAVAGFAAVVAALQRVVFIAVYRSWFRQGMAGDAAFHLVLARQLQQDPRYVGIPHFLIKDEPDTYPILFHRFAALFPASLLERWPYLPNFVLWVAFCAFVAAYAHYVGSALMGAPGVAAALAFVVLFLCLASNLSSDMNGLNYISLSERLLSRFVCSLYFCALPVWMTFGDTPSLVIAVAAGAAVLLSSMFGRQAATFVTPVAALIALDWRPLAAIALAFLVALAIDGRYLLRGIRHMAQFSHAYNHHTKHSRYYKLGLSHFTNWRRVLGRGIGLNARLVELESNEPTRIFSRYPELVLLVAAAWSGSLATSGAATAVIVATILVYLATSTPQFRHFGEANRYIEYSLWLIVPLTLAFPVADGSIPPLWLAIYAAWIALITVRRYRVWSSLRFPESDQLGNFLRPLNLRPEHTLFTVPFSLGAAICSRVTCRSLMYQGSAVTLALYRKFMEEIPFLKRDWQGLASEFGVTHIVAEKSYLTAMHGIVGWEYDFSSAEKLAECERYVAYRVKVDSQAARAAA